MSATVPEIQWTLFEHDLVSILVATNDIRDRLPLLSTYEKRVLRDELRRAIDRLDAVQVACLD